MDQAQMLTKSAQAVQEALANKGLSCQVIELPDSARTAQDAAVAIGCDVAQIMKSLIFKTESTNQAVLLLVSGPNRVNEKIIESYVGEKIVKADAQFAKDVTGFAIGGIPPIGHKHKIEHIFIDEDLMKFDVVWAAAGTPQAVFSLRGDDLLKMVSAKLISFHQ